MIKISKQLDFFLKLSRVQSIVARSFDRTLGRGLGFTDFIILYYLSQAPGEKMRRVDLAEKVTLTASGVTRLLLPMEKIGLIKRESDDADARVSYVKLAAGGKHLLEDCLEKAELISSEFLHTTKVKDAKDISDMFENLTLGQILD